MWTMTRELNAAATKNRLLNAFESESRARVDPHLESVEVKLGDVVCEAGGVIKHAYFPDGAVLSLLTVLESGSAIETANIGREGAFGLFAAMYRLTSFNRCLVQLAGDLLRVPIDVLRWEFEHHAHIRNIFVTYSELLLAQIQQTVACNALHTTRQKICRWLLMMHDRAHGEDLTYTHEFLAEVLGVNRKSVTLAAQALQRAAKGGPHRLSSGENASSRSLRPRTRVMRMLRGCQGAFRCLLEAASACDSGTYARTEIARATGLFAGWRGRRLCKFCFFQFHLKSQPGNPSNP